MIASLKKNILWISGDRRSNITYLKKLGVYLGIFMVIFFFGFYVIWRPHFEIAQNKTTSLPEHYFLVVKGMAVHRGDFVSFYPPDNPLYGNKTPFLKIVGGVAGDVVKEKGREVYVNHKDLGHIYLHADDGKPLHAGPTGTISQGEYYVYTPNPKSYDSRYASIGWIPQKQIIGRAFPLF